MPKKWYIVVAVIAAVVVFGPGSASAATSIKQSPSASAPQGYCGPPVTSKAAVVSYYKSHPAGNLETYVRAYAGYYHIQPDQGFASWLDQPNVKVFPAPAGYKIDTNTYCKPDGTVAPYNGRYDVGGKLMMWWCTDARGYNCTPIAKGYCQNMVTGKAIRPIPKPVMPGPKIKRPAGKPSAAINAVCSVVIVGNNNHVAASQCNLYQVQMVCSNGPVTITGPNAKVVTATANNYRTQNCPAAKMSPAKPLVTKPPVPPGKGLLAITKTTPGVAKACFRFHLWVRRGSARVRSTDFALCTNEERTFSLLTGTTVDVRENGAKGWVTAQPCNRTIAVKATVRCDFVNQKVAIPQGGFTAIVTKKVMNSVMTTDFTSFYKAYRLPMAVWINGRPSFPILVPMDGNQYSVSKDGRAPFVFSSGDTVKLCEDLGFTRGLVLEPVSPVGTDGCLVAQKGGPGLSVFTFVNRAMETSRQPTAASPTTSPSAPVTPPAKGNAVPPPPPGGSAVNPPPTPPSQSAAPTGGNTSQCQDQYNTSTCQAPPP